MQKEIKLTPDEYYPMREDMYGSLERYLNHGIKPGSFLMAVLQNDLAGACGRADNCNIRNIPNIVGYIYNHLPGSSWGSAEKVQDYLKKFKEAV